MAKNPKSQSAPSESITLTQQSVNLTRQFVNAVGWAKTIEDIAIGGELLVRVLPTLDPTDWIKSPKEVEAFSPSELKAYLDKDRQWGTKPFTFALTEKQKAVVTKAIRHWADEAAKAGRLGPSEWLTELITVFGITDGEGKAE